MADIETTPSFHRIASATQSELAGILARYRFSSENPNGWDAYPALIREIAATLHLRRLVEIGGGRDPLFSADEVAALGLDYTVNDIAEGELACLPSSYRKACFDVASRPEAVAQWRGEFDFAFSRMVFEHVRDGRQAWRNLSAMLAPGGVAVAYMPVLFSPPFVANRLIPDRLAASIVRALYPARRGEEDPVFPARYSWCVAISSVMTRRLRGVGFDEVHVVPFWHHDYYARVPVLRDVDRAAQKAFAVMNWSALASYAYVVARKAPADTKEGWPAQLDRARPEPYSPHTHGADSPWRKRGRSSVG